MNSVSYLLILGRSSLHSIRVLKTARTNIFAAVQTLLLLGVLTFFAGAITPISAAADDWSMPSPSGPVNDYAGVIDDATEQALNKRLIDFQRSSGVELAVAVVKTTGGKEIFDYSVEMARAWGIGSKGDDNPGLLLVVAINDRKYFTQVSRDLEDELPDALVGSIQRQYLVPEFKKGNYAKGISDTVEAYIAVIEKRSSGTAASPTPVGGYTDPGDSGSLFTIFCCLVIIGIIILVIWANRGGGGKSKKDNDRWGGGFGGGGALPWIIGSAIGSASSGSSSSGSWSSGGSDWGGFGGGGDFGGGGAGGGW